MAETPSPGTVAAGTASSGQARAGNPSTGITIGPADSEQIRLARVICIFFMVSVHFKLGTFSDAINTSAIAYAIEFLWAEVLGRASVALLSFVSGYLLIVATRPDPKKVARKKFFSVYLPMLSWNFLFILLQFTRCARGTALEICEPSYWALEHFPISDLTGAFVGVVAWPLSFLRELFVTNIIVAALAPLLGRYSLPLILISLVDVGTYFLEPLILRPPVLLFVLLGAVAATKGVTLVSLSSLRIAVPGALISGAAFAILYFGFPDSELSVLYQNIFMRSGLIFFLFWLTRGMLKFKASRAISYFESDVFIAYLCHLPVFFIFWQFGARIGGNENLYLYLFLYITVPMLVLAFSKVFGHLLGYAPAALQLLLRGRVRRPASRKGAESA
ncbi:MAG: acyltransferase [Pseudomonadota bacterium]